MKMTILATCGGYDIELHIDIDDINMIGSAINHMVENAPEVKPRPRFQGNKPTVAMPFGGTIEKTELVPAKNGKKEYCLAHVKHEDGTIIEVRYFPPQKTWRAGEEVKVQKGQYGPELKEIEEDDAIPF